MCEFYYFQKNLYTLSETYRAIDLNSLLGYMGGYVGVLLGCSILQVPELILDAFTKIKRLCSDRLRVEQI